MDTFICREFKVLPTDERFITLENEQKLALYESCIRTAGSEAIRRYVFEEDEKDRKIERVRKAAAKPGISTLLIDKMVDSLVARGMPKEKAIAVSKSRAKAFAAAVEKSRIEKEEEEEFG